MKEVKEQIIIILILIIAVFGVVSCERKYNTEEHSDDVIVTEWVSPDGVHYWYRNMGQQAMLAPRYDSEGNLVIDEVE